MPSTPVLMPQMGESIAEGTIVVWLKQPGDRVEKDEPLFEISTDKVDAEIPAPASGFLLETLFGPGETVEVNKVVATIGEQGGASATSPASAPSAGQPAPAAAGASAAQAAPQAPVVAPTLAAVAETSPHHADPRKIRSSPLVRKLAREHEVDLMHVPGTGDAGRVTKHDILSFVESGARTAPQPAAPSNHAAATAPAARPAAAAPRPSSDKYRYTPGANDKVEPFTPMRTAISDHMVISRETSVHVTTVFEVDMTRVAKLRARHKPAYAERGVNLTFMPFIMNAVCGALREFPILNSSIQDNQVYYKQQVNLGMAVALDWGLLVPVIKNADELSLLGLSRSVSDLAERARSKKLSPDEVAGGTFTVTNPGVFGSLFGTPIINQPQVAILGVGTITKRAVVTDDDAIAVRSMMYLALSFDHRAIDGATADRFMSRIKNTLQEFPEGLL